MGLLINCPNAASINSVPLNECYESLGQVQKVVFQRLYDGTTRNSISASVTPITTLAAWTPLLAAVDGTKVVQSPYIQSPETEPGAAINFGGGNETLGGIEITVGAEPTAFTGNVLRSTQDTIKALKGMMAENLGVYIIDEHGRIACEADDYGTPTEYYPIPIRNLFIGDKKLGGYEGVDMNAISWKFFPNWSDDLKILVPTDFNALTDLVTP